MATLKDVARLACVDVSTVSRALSGKGYVHPNTRAKINAAVKQLSYQPNLLAKGLREGKRNVVGLVVPTLNLSVFSEIAQGIEERARQSGYETLLCHTDDDPDREEQLLRRLRSSYMDGLIIAPTGQNQRLLRDMRADGLPVVQVVRFQDKTLNSVVLNFYDCGYNGTRYLTDRGCRSVGLINGSTDLAPYRDRYRGYRRAMREAGLPELVANDLFPRHTHFQSGYLGLQSLLQREGNLDGVVVSTDMQGLGAIRALKEAGMRVPEDVRLISLSGHSIGGMLETAMTSMEMPLMEMGRSAMEVLLKDLEARSTGAPTKAEHIVFEATLVRRETT